MFQPLMEYVRRRSGSSWGIVLEESWTARSNCTPDLDGEVRRVETSLARLSGRAALKLGKEAEGKKLGAVNWNGGEVTRPWRKFMEGKEGAPTKEMLDELKTHLTAFVIAPQDKNVADGVIM